MTARLFLHSAMVVYILGLMGCSECSNRGLSRAAAPDGVRAAVVFERSCGATTPFSVHVSLVPAEARLKNEAGNLFIADNNRGVLSAKRLRETEVQWISENRLVIYYPEGVRIFLQRTESDGISIIYKYK